MRSNSKSLWRLISSLIVVFLVVGAVAIWYVNPLTQQRAFGFLVSAELVAFSMLVYIYSRSSFTDYGRINKSWLLVEFAALVALVLLSVFVSQ